MKIRLKQNNMHKNSINIALSMIRYNLKIIFANKFVYFLIAAVAFYLLVTGIMLFSDFTPTVRDIYATLIFPGLLIIFYPVVFNIQNDKDSRMLEIIFSIPNYRYNIYLVRFIISIFLLMVILAMMSYISVFLIARFDVITMLYQLMYPMLFIASLSFMLTTLVKNASGAAVILIIIGLFFWILSEPLQYSKWNIFLNPFNIPTEISYNIWKDIVFQNRLMLIVGTVIFMLWALFNLQRREKFV